MKREWIYYTRSWNAIIDSRLYTGSNPRILRIFIHTHILFERGRTELVTARFILYFDKHLSLVIMRAQKPCNFAIIRLSLQIIMPAWNDANRSQSRLYNYEIVEISIERDNTL